MILLLSILAAALPTAIYVSLIYWIDRYEKEPLGLLAAAFFWGAVPSIIIAFIVNTTLTLPICMIAGDVICDVAGASFIAPFVEESLKGMALLILLYFWHNEIDSILDGIIYGAMIGMGFAMVENVYYFINVYADGGLSAWGFNIFLRAVVFGLNHALFTSMTGIGIAVSRMSRNTAVRWSAPLLGWMAAMFLHFVHNLSASLGGILCLVLPLNSWGGVLMVIVIMVWALIQEKKWITFYLQEEVELGTFEVIHYQKVSTNAHRFTRQATLLLAGDIAQYRHVRLFHQRCAELAYKKHHYHLFAKEGDMKEMLRLRAEIGGLAPKVIL